MSTSPFLTKLSLWSRIKTRSLGWRLMKEPQPKQWCFIVGCYNSGTTLLNQLLGLHPEIGTMPNEGQFYTDQLVRGAHVGLRRLWALKPELFRLDENTVTTIDSHKLKREWAYFYNDVSRPVLLEKTIANAARTRWFQKHFSPASFIVLVRDPYAVAEGIRRKEKHSLEDAITQWKVSYQQIFEDLGFLERKLVLTYEELTANPRETLNKITSFLGIAPFEMDMAGKEFTVHRVKSEISNKNGESYKKLTEEDYRTINKIAGEWIKRLGYEERFM